MVALTTVAGSVAAAAGALLVAWPIAIWCVHALNKQRGEENLGARILIPRDSGTYSEACIITSRWEVRKLEKPKYVVTRTLKTRQTPFFGTTAEIRSYAPFLTAEVSSSKGGTEVAILAPLCDWQCQTLILVNIMQPHSSGHTGGL